MNEVIEQFVGTKMGDGAAAKAVSYDTVGIALLGRENRFILSGRKGP